MINYEDYIYNQECVFSKQNLKNRLEKQLGDFGEQLVMTLLGRIAGYSVAYVDHEGADLIATDPNNKDGRYAISVKSAQIGPTENETKVFKKSDQKKLCVFAKDFKLIPAIAMVFIPKDFAFIDVYLVTLDAFNELAEKDNDEIEKNAIKSTREGIQINNFSLGTGKSNIKHSDKKGYLKYLHSNELIEHIRLDVHNRNNFRKGIRQAAKDGTLDDKCIDKLVQDRKNEDENNKDRNNNGGNLSRQLGDAGEYFLTMLLGQQKKFKVARVDHVGADLIATDKKGKRYAISVKTCQTGSYEFYELYTNDKSIKSPKRELWKLQDFAEKYALIPVIACIFIKKGFKGIDIYISTLDNWINKAFHDCNKAICFNPMSKNEKTTDAQEWQQTMKTFKIDASTPDHRKYLNSTNGIEHIELAFSNKLNADVKWQ